MNTFHRFFTRALFVLCLISASNSMAILPGGCIPEAVIVQTLIDKGIEGAKAAAVIAILGWLGLPNSIRTNPVLDSSVLTTVCF